MLKPAHPFVNSIDPMRFFDGETIGHGIVCGMGGKLIRRCIIKTTGEAASEYGAMHFDENYIFDDGSPDDTMHWAVSRGSVDAFDASEISVFGKVKSQLTGSRWKIAFDCQSPPPAKEPRFRYEVCFDQVTEDVVTKLVRIKLFGVPVARMWAYHQRV